MRFWKLWVRVVLLGVILLSGRGAFAAPVTCSYGYQDSTCGTFLSNSPQVAPTCSSGAGWTTVSPAKWIGSQYSAPQCNYQAPPSCPPGWITTASPGWTGSFWTGPFCQIPAAPTNPCQYGYASGPTWTGSSWTYTCNAPPPTVTCASEAQAQGYTLTDGYGTSGPFTGYYIKFDGSYGYGTYNNVEYGATGPVWTDSCGNSGNTYLLYCPVSRTDGSALGQLTGNTTSPGSAACGGPN
ncbi:hypothetical protein R69746_06555 [Paraburkholderia aspalathi]|nr:hypothetical protein R69746_06555 [Paraburkholderia aspalathi]